MKRVGALGLVAIPLGVWRGFVVMLLWRWFVEPLGVPGLNLWAAAGMSWVVAYLTAIRISEDDEQPSVSYVVSFSIVWGAVAVGTGAALHALAVAA